MVYNIMKYAGCITSGLGDSGIMFRALHDHEVTWGRPPPTTPGPDGLPGRPVVGLMYSQHVRRHCVCPQCDAMKFSRLHVRQSVRGHIFGCSKNRHEASKDTPSAPNKTLIKSTLFDRRRSNDGAT